jgi:3-deoxy-manno-octulosonate cytidylyltransferase (CMP-KDO synthetase)
LLEISGKPMLQHVYEKALQSGAISVAIATDDERIAKAAEEFGAKVCMTSKEHASGTDRIAEAVVTLGLNDNDIVVNIQGDEPLIPPKPIHQVASNLVAHDNVKVATLCEPIDNIEDLSNHNIVKVVLNQRNHALYFSRSPIPCASNIFSDTDNQATEIVHYRHRGIYAYRVGFLLEYMEWTPSPLEKIERLEQLRTLWYGGRIHVAISKEKIPSDVNTPDDLERVRKLLKKSKK